jgi:hypothetical protein
VPTASLAKLERIGEDARRSARRPPLSEQILEVWSFGWGPSVGGCGGLPAGFLPARRSWLCGLGGAFSGDHAE